MADAPDAQFLDGIALSGILPAPLIIFSTFIGFLAGGWTGALAMTAGIFAPAFAFTLIGHALFERLVHDPRAHRFLDGVTAGVVGLVAATGIDVTCAALGSIPTVVIFAICLLVLFRFGQRWTIPGVVLASGLAGVLLHVFRH